MIQITNSPTANKLISVHGINEIDSGKMIVKAINKDLGTGFFTPRTKFAFAKLG